MYISLFRLPPHVHHPRKAYSVAFVRRDIEEGAAVIIHFKVVGIAIFAIIYLYVDVHSPAFAFRYGVFGHLLGKIQSLSTPVWHAISMSEIGQIRVEGVARHLYVVAIRQGLGVHSLGIYMVNLNGISLLF